MTFCHSTASAPNIQLSRRLRACRRNGRTRGYRTDGSSCERFSSSSIRFLSVISRVVPQRHMIPASCWQSPSCRSCPIDRISDSVISRSAFSTWRRSPISRRRASSARARSFVLSRTFFSDGTAGIVTYHLPGCHFGTEQSISTPPFDRSTTRRVPDMACVL